MRRSCIRVLVDPRLHPLNGRHTKRCCSIILMDSPLSLTIHNLNWDYSLFSYQISFFFFSSSCILFNYTQPKLRLFPLLLPNLIFFLQFFLYTFYQVPRSRHLVEYLPSRKSASNSTRLRSKDNSSTRQCGDRRRRYHYSLLERSGKRRPSRTLWERQ
jgi:hypothetical protein